MTITSVTTTIPQLAHRTSPAARRSVATVSLGDGTLEEKLAAAAAAGFDGVELCEPDLQASRLSPAEAGRAAADLGLRFYLYQPFRDFEAVHHGCLLIKPVMVSPTFCT